MYTGAGTIMPISAGEPCTPALPTVKAESADLCILLHKSHFTRAIFRLIFLISLLTFALN